MAYSKHPKTKKKTVNQIVTERIINSLCAGQIPWRKPWCMPMDSEMLNYVTRKPYGLLNKLLLDKPGEYMTFNQAKSLNGRIKKGGKSKQIMTYFPVIKPGKEEEVKRLEALGENADHLKDMIPNLKSVFHLDDIEGLETKIVKNEMKPALGPTGMASYVINHFTNTSGVRIVEKKGDFCGYDDEKKTITVPEKSQFYTEEEWYGKVFAAMTDWHSDKNSDIRDKRVLKDLVTEMASSMMLCGVRLERKESIENTNAICTRWIRELGNDFSLIISAAKKAEKAASDLLAGIA